MFDVMASMVVYKSAPEMAAKAAGSFLATALPVRLVVVDNSPTRALEKCFNDPRIEYVFTGKNIGFGQGHNRAIAMSDGRARYHLVLNPDVYFDPGTVEKLFRFAEANLDIGLLMPQVRYPDGSLQYLCKLLPTPWDGIGRRFVPWWPGNRKRDRRYEMRERGYEHVMDVPFLSGCFMFIRRSVLKEAGGFDPRFFLHYEDVDLCRRIRALTRTVYYPDARIVHVHARESYKNLRHLRIQAVSAIKYFNKWGWFRDRERSRINASALAGCPCEK